MRALVVWGGWDGHEPDHIADYFSGLLRDAGVDVELSNTLDAFLDPALMSDLDLIVPVWTMGEISPEQSRAATAAVLSGTGIAGCHGGMCDAFRSDPEWQFMTGGQWVAHPGDDQVTYRVTVRKDFEHPVSLGVPDFDITSEQYYLHVDPGVTVLATTTFPHPGVPGPHEGNPCQMPQAWVKQYGSGRVFYYAPGHRRTVLEEPGSKAFCRQGVRWALRSRSN